MIKDIILNVSRSYNPYVQSNEIWGAGQTLAGELDNDFNARKFATFDNLPNWNVITVNTTNAIGIKNDGTLWSWGPNTVGNLGQNDTINRSSPVQLGTGTWVSASVTPQSSFAISSNGTLWGWGLNTSGDLGLGDLITRSSPVQIGTRTWKNIFGSALAATIALRSDDTIWGWGDTRNTIGIYGNGERPGAFGQIDGGSLDWNDFTVGSSYTIAVGSDGTMWGWGLNTGGQLGLNDVTNRSNPTQIGTVSTWVSASAEPDGNYTLAIQNNGTLWAWGNNSSGQLGLNNLINRSSPVQVGTETNWYKAAAGNGISYAIKTNGTMWAWGTNNVNSLGQSDNELRQIDNLTTWVSGSFNGSMILTLKTDGTMWSWGANSSGELGLGDTVTRSSPVQIGTRLWKKISVSSATFSSFGIRDDDTLWSWGNNGAGGLGLGPSVNRSSPVQIGTRTWTEISNGNFGQSLAIRSDGTLWAWGFGNNGALGQNNTTNFSSPVQIGTETNWSKISIGHGSNAFAIRTDGTMWAWGENANYGTLGLGDRINRSSPVQIGTRADWVDVRTGGQRTGAIRSDGTLWTWGYNEAGQLGLGDKINKSSPVQVGTDTNWLRVEFNEAITDAVTSFAIKTDKTLWGWGHITLKDNINTGGLFGGPYVSPVQIGEGEQWETVTFSGGNAPVFAITSNNKLYSGPGTSPSLTIWGRTGVSSPIQVGTETNWAKIHAVGNRGTAIKTDGTLWGWGAAAAGFPILNFNYTSVGKPTLFNSDNWDKVQSGGGNVIGIKTNGTLWAWGANSLGSLGLGDTIGRSSPVQVGTRLWNDISAGGGGTNTFAVRNDGTLWAWGRNQTYQLGLVDLVSRSSPVQVGGDTNWLYVTTGAAHTAAIKNRLTKELHTAGVANTYGGNYRLINGWDGVRRSPILLSETNPWKQVMIGNSSAFGVKTDGTIWSWGLNSSGELGDGTIISRSSPVQIGTETNWSSVSHQANNVTHGIKTDGTLWGWGANTSGQLGIGVAINRSSPVQVGTRLWNYVAHNGASGTFAVRNDGTLWSWGTNFSGQLGLNDTISRSSPVQIGTETNWSRLAYPQNRPNTPSFAFKQDGSVYVVNGTNFAPDITTGISFYKSSPVQVTSTRNWRSVNAGTSFTIAISTSGSIWAWGTQTNGVMGNNVITTGANQESPVQIGTLTTWASASAGEGNVVAIRNDNTIWTWGANNTGQLGLNDTVDRSSPVQVGTLTNWSIVSAGRSHVMAVKTDGTLWGWGINLSNNIGDLTSTNRSSPVQIGTATNWSKVSAGDGHTMAINTTGELYAMGWGNVGQLGRGNVSNGITPQQVGTQLWSDVAAGQQMTVAVRSDGTLWAWGSNTFGRLGLFRDRSRPNFIIQSTNFTDVEINEGNAIARSVNGTIWSWGDNTNGSLGLGDTIIRSSPVQIGTLTWDKFSMDFNNGFLISSGSLWGFGNSANLGLYEYGPKNVVTSEKFIKASAGERHDLAISSTNLLWGWGQNSFGQLGLNNTVTRSSPVQIGTLTWNEQSAGASYSMAIRSDGTLWGWGVNGSGQLGLNDTVTRSSPVQIGTRTWTNISAGLSHTTAIRNDGTIWSWGLNTSGQLGLNIAASDVRSPVQIGTRADWTRVSSGDSHTMAIRSDGTLWSWGINTSGQLADATLTTRSSPVQVGTDTNWTNVSAGNNITTALKTDGTVWTWGANSGANRLGLWRNPFVPNYVNHTTPFRVVKSTGSVGFAIGIDNTLWAWGSGTNGILGLGDTNQRISPVQVGTRLWNSIHVAGNVTAIRNDGTLWTWGDNTNGLLGLGDTISRSSPVQVGTDTNWSKVLDNGLSTSSFAIKTDGTLWAWGLNGDGQLGDGTSINRSSPVQVGTRTWSSITSGQTAFLQGSSFAIRSDGTLWAWGNNQYGQLGSNNQTARISPVQVGTLTWLSVAAGPAVSAVRSDGTLWFWGRGDSSQSPLNDQIYRSSPVQVGTETNWKTAVGLSGGATIIKTDGTIWTWGLNGNGQLGLGDTINRSSPVQIGTLNTWVSASVQTLLSSDGYALSTPGNVTYGVAGYENQFNISVISVPVQIGAYAVDKDWRVVDTANGGGIPKAIGIKTNGTLWSWGVDANAELGGDEAGITRSSPVQIGTLNTWASASIASLNSVLLLNDGTALTTGTGAEGYTPFATNRSSPVQIGTLSNWSSIDAGGTSATFAIKTDGTLWAWGSNTSGQLGNNRTAAILSPVQIGTDTNWSSTSNVGNGCVYAIKTNGTLWSWGNNTSGQLGLNDTVTRSSPAQIGTRTDWYRLANITGGSTNHVLAIRNDGTLWGWGIGSSGELGIAVNMSIPNQPLTNQKFSDVKVGNAYTMAINTNGTLWGWGGNSSGQIGDNTFTLQNSPVQIGTRIWNKVNPGSTHTLAIRNDGTLWAWGGNASGQLGNNTQFGSVGSPVQLGTLTTWVQIEALDQTSYAIRNDGTLWSWGANNTGQLGLNLATTASRSSPVQVGTETNWSKLADTSAFGSFTMAIKTDGTLWSWGANDWGQLGLGNTVNRSSPVQIGTETNWLSAAHAQNYSLAIKTDGTLYSWGISGGQLGTENNFISRSSPVQIGTRSWRSVFVGQDFVHAIRNDGTLWAWGSGAQGRLGINDGLGTARSSPVQVGTLNTWVSGSGGFDNAGLLLNDGNVYMTGTGAAVGFDTNFTVSRSSPVQIGTDTNWLSAAASRQHSFAIKTNGTLWAWGNNGSAILGLGDTINRSSPVQVGTLNTWASASGATNFGIGALLTNAGRIATVGTANNAVVGYDLTLFSVNRSSPAQIGADTDWKSVAAGHTNFSAAGNQVIAQKTDGTLWTWGSNTAGNLGDGTLTGRSSPVQIGNDTTWVDFEAQLHFVGIKRY